MDTRSPNTRRQAAFTLVEILGAFFIMTIILTLVTSIFVENGRQRAASLGMMKEGLSAAAALEQVAADLEGALFVKAEDGRPDENPWRFVGEGFGELGSESVRFVTQNAPMSNRGEHASQWVEVAYFVEENDAGERSLWRWLSPRPPTEVTSGFPSAGDDGTMRLAVGVDDLGFRFRDTEGEWLDEWDSSYQPPETPMPSAVEFNLRLFRDARPGETDDESNQVAALLHKRRVVLPMPVISVDDLIELGQNDDDDDDAGCFTVSDCLAEGDSGWYEDVLDDDCEGDEELCELLSNSEETCWDEISTQYAALASEAPTSCAP